MNRLWLLILPLVMISIAQADDKIKIDEVVVTATRYEEQVTHVPASVSVITTEDINNSSARNIPELLKTEAGVQVSDITGNSRSYTVDVRGFGETAILNTLVLVDGRRINQADLSGVDWMNIPLERVSRIEIIRGARGSVLYGDNATGGVINIITKEGGEGFKGGLDLASGSFRTFKADAYASGSLKGLSLHLSGKYLTSDGYRDNSKTEAKDVGLNAVYYLKDFMKIDLNAGYHKDHTGLPGALKESDFVAGASRTDTRFPDDFAETEDYYIQFAPEAYVSENVALRLDTSFRKRDFLSFSSGDFGSFTGNSRIKTTALSPQVILKQQFHNVNNKMTAGVDYQKTDDDIVNDSLFFGTRSIGMFKLEKENYGYYLHDEISIAEALRLSGGYRHDRARFTFDPSTPDSVTMSSDSYTIGVNYTFFRKSYLYASYSRGFRYPVLDEIYSFFTNTINTSLAPQTSDDYEIGIRHYFNNDFYAQVNVFRLDTDREIFFNPTTFQNENLDGKTRRDGAEFSFFAAATSWLSLRGSYTVLSAEVEEGTFAGEKVPNVPKHKASMDVMCQINKAITATLTGIYVGERPFISDFANEFSNQDDYFILNAKFSYRWKSLKAFVDINNITNKEYSEYGVLGGFPLEKAFYPSPKRSFLLGLAVEF